MARQSFEFKVGIFVFVGIVILSYIVFSIGDFYGFKKGYTIRAKFSFANGIEPAAPVRLAGITVGEVKKTKILYDPGAQKTSVELVLWLSGDAKVEEDAQIYINTLGLIGEKYVEIIPGSVGKRLLKNEESIMGKDSVPMDKLTEKGYSLVCKLEEAADSLNYILKQVREEKGTIGKLLLDDTVYKNIEEMTVDLKRHPWKLLQKPRGEE